MGNHPAAKFDPSKAQSMSMLGRYCVIIECKVGSMHRALGCVLYIATYGNGQGKMLYIDCLVQYCSNSSALAMELLRCCCKPSIYNMLSHCLVPSLAIDIKRDLGIYLWMTNTVAGYVNHPIPMKQAWKINIDRQQTTANTARHGVRIYFLGDQCICS